MSFDEWKTNNPQIDTEHKNLHRMLSSLRAVIAAGSTPELVAEALSVMKERLRLHFEAEEQYVLRMDHKSYESMRQSHLVLMKALDTMKEAVRQSRAAGLAALGEFMEALEQHDQDMDLPTFRRLGGIGTTPAD